MACGRASCASGFGLNEYSPSICIVIQSVAKDLVYIKVDAPEIFRTESSTTRLRHFVPLNDKNAQDDINHENRTITTKITYYHEENFLYGSHGDVSPRLL